MEDKKLNLENVKMDDIINFGMLKSVLVEVLNSDDGKKEFENTPLRYINLNTVLDDYIEYFKENSTDMLEIGLELSFACWLADTCDKFKEDIDNKTEKQKADDAGVSTSEYRARKVQRPIHRSIKDNGTFRDYYSAKSFKDLYDKNDKDDDLETDDFYKGYIIPVFSSKEDAECILNKMRAHFGESNEPFTYEDLCNLVEIATISTDNFYGWNQEDVDNARIVKNDDGTYKIQIVKPKKVY